MPRVEPLDRRVAELVLEALVEHDDVGVGIARRLRARLEVARERPRRHRRGRRQRRRRFQEAAPVDLRGRPRARRKIDELMLLDSHRGFPPQGFLPRFRDAGPRPTAAQPCPPMRGTFCAAHAPLAIQRQECARVPHLSGRRLWRAGFPKERVANLLDEATRRRVRSTVTGASRWTVHRVGTVALANL